MTKTDQATQSGIIRQIEGSRRIQGFFYPILSFHEDGETTNILPVDQGGFAVMPEEWDELDKRVRAFYAANDLTELREHNRQNQPHWNRDE